MGLGQPKGVKNVFIKKQKKNFKYCLNHRDDT